LKRDGLDPRVKKRASTQLGKTFKEFAEEQYPGWCKGLSKEEEKQWARSIRDVPSLHDLKVHEITTEHVQEALKPIWSVKPVTASRTRQRIERYHNFRREVLEFCLSHCIGDEAELSYWDSEMIARRREALQAWADFRRAAVRKKAAKTQAGRLPQRF
jgi:hypothetical protein